MNKHPKKNSAVAVFVTPHGFGHAARASAVMEALYARDPDIIFDIYTGTPPWFFDDSLSAPFNIHTLMTDIGVVQTSALKENIPATIDRLSELYPLQGYEIDRLCEQISRRNYRCIICDIAPMGIHVALKTKIPSILIENFTWDWIYRSYASLNQRIKHFIDYLENLFPQADIHIQTEPLCRSIPVDLTVGPVCRKPRLGRENIRKKLSLPKNSKIVLITMGGVPESYGFIEQLQGYPDISFVVAGGSESTTVKKNIIFLSQHSGLYHPDLVNASDAVIGKLGYSTLAEVYHTGIPFGYVTRPLFPESEKLARYVESEIHCMNIDPETFQSGTWLTEIRSLLEKPRINRKEPNGADQIATFILEHPFWISKDRM